ncbi:MAG: hypothetical protein L0I29_06325 [Hyphomicrobiales bacterium]|nr:hypothetical protein [Hyphomicrobiales bacterium]
MLKGLFRQRSAERDRDNDAARAERIVKLLVEVRAELELERKGLQERYDRTVGNASTLSFAIDGEGASDWSDRKLKDLESGMIYCETRTKSIAGFDREIAALQDTAEKLLERRKA